MLAKPLKTIHRLRSAVLGINERNLDYIYRFNPRRFYNLADDKFITKSILEQKGIACPKTYGVISKIGDIEPVWYQVQHHEKVVIKPAKGRGGGGILVLKKKEGEWYASGKVITTDQIFSHIANVVFGIYSIGDQDKAIIEECVIPHPFFGEIYPAGVPDLRVIMFENKAVMAMLRMPTERSDGKANIHQGGLGIGIDIKSGRLTRVYDGKRFYMTHPDNGHQITGLPLPYWKAILELSLDTSKAFPLDYLGVDIVIDRQKGPMVMEINVRPGLAIQIANQKGLKEVLKSA